MVTVAVLVAAWFLCLWWTLRKCEPVEPLVEEAQRAGLCSHLDLELWTEREPLRAKLGEHAPSPTRVGVAFVRESRALQANSSLLAPQLVGGERVMTITSAVPRAVYDAVLARPADQRLEALLVMEANRLRTDYEARGQDVPPEEARF